jgi:hypothetical protein
MYKHKRQDKVELNTPTLSPRQGGICDLQEKRELKGDELIKPL